MCEINLQRHFSTAQAASRYKADYAIICLGGKYGFRRSLKSGGLCDSSEAVIVAEPKASNNAQPAAPKEHLNQDEGMAEMIFRVLILIQQMQLFYVSYKS